MQVILLATGETDRLRPLTETITAPMIPVANRPLMVYPIEMLARQGYKQMLASLYHLGGSIEAYFGSGQRWGVEIEYVLQKDAWGSAGALKWAERSLTDTFLVLPADALIDLDVAAVLAQHQARKSAVTVVVHAAGHGEPLCLDAEDRLVEHQTSLSDGEAWYDTGVYIFEPQVLDKIPARTHVDIRRQLLPSLLQDGLPVHAYRAHSYWNEMIDLVDYHAAQRAYLHQSEGSNLYFDPLSRKLETRQIGQGIWVGRNHVIHPTVRLAPPVYIGDNCQIGRDVEIGPDVVIGKNVIIDDEATVFQSTILNQSYVGQLVNVENRIVNKNVIIDIDTAERTEVVDEFLLGEVHPALLATGLLRLWDTAVSLFLLLVTLPLTLLLALLTLLTSGRIFESVPRLGMPPRGFGDGRSPGLRAFSLLRFCTHHKDGQLTGLGGWLEKWDGHRLPELLNVLRGDMSMVGVKPLPVEAVNQINEAWQEQRHSYQSGFTGLWYLQNGRNAQLDETLITDTYYVATRTWREDQRILWQTPAAWSRHTRRAVISKLPT